MNCFIETFLQMINDTLVQMNAELKEKSELLNMAVQKIDVEPTLEGKENLHKDIMLILAQNHFFDSSVGLTIKELATIVSKSEATIRKIVKELITLRLIEQKGERPAYYCMKQEYFEV